MILLKGFRGSSRRRWHGEDMIMFLALDRNPI